MYINVSSQGKISRPVISSVLTHRGSIPGTPMQITEVAQDTYLIDPASDSEFSLGEIAYLLVDNPPVLIEPGSTTTASRLLSRSRELSSNLDKVEYIIPTHIHVDHGGGSGFLAQKLPHTKVVLHPQGAKHMAEPAKLIHNTRLVFGEDFEATFGPILPVPSDQIHVAHDSEVIHLGKRQLKVVFSPGHASHHIAIFDSLTRGVFCGEALGIIPDNLPDFPLPAAVPPFELQLYLETIDMLAHLHPSLLFYSHCGPRCNAQKLIQQVKENAVVFGHIVQKALEAGESDQKIWEHLTDHIKERFPGAELPVQYQLALSGYTSYFLKKQIYHSIPKDGKLDDGVSGTNVPEPN
jgi:glyoxylase-like metal-dependent hydrolase (beta-lactamase superfamily II)